MAEEKCYMWKVRIDDSFVAYDYVIEDHKGETTIRQLAEHVASCLGGMVVSATIVPHSSDERIKQIMREAGLE